MARNRRPLTLAEALAWADAAPPGTTVPAEWLADVLRQVADAAPAPEPAPAPDIRPAEPAPVTWRERLWTAPSETRIGRDELLEALGRPRSWLYRHTSKASGLPMIPHRKMDGELLFVVGEVRAWLRDHEEVVVAGPMDGPRRPHLKAS